MVEIPRMAKVYYSRAFDIYGYFSCSFPSAPPTLGQVNGNNWKSFGGRPQQLKAKKMLLKLFFSSCNILVQRGREKHG